MSENGNTSDEQNEIDPLQYVQMITQIRQQAFKQIIYGLLWWMGSAVAMYFALAATGETTYWYGGAIVSLFHWYRAFKMISATKKAGAKPLVRNEAILVAVTAVLVIFSTVTIVPEYVRINSPTIGTCWAKAENNTTENNDMVPVACWSNRAIVKAISLEPTHVSCPEISTGYFDPSERDDNEYRVTCLIDN
jgi:hypothetical protein